MIDTVLLFFLIIITIILIAAIVIILGKLNSLTQSKSDQTLTLWLQTIQRSMEALNSNVSTNLNQNNKQVTDSLYKTTAEINKRLDVTLSVFGDASKEISRMNELGQSIKNLQLLLQSPKLRGGIGEEILADMLGQVLPKNQFSLQYSFKTGSKVDAVIKTTAGLLCIDAKFPMENFQKQVKADSKQEQDGFLKLFTGDVKKHIKDIAQKYILPDEKTVDFAFMYVPSEAIFYEIANNTDILNFAKTNRVYPVSPNTLHMHLQTILLAFEGQRIEARAKQVMTLLKALQGDYAKLDENLGVLGRHLTNASNQFSNTSQQFGRLGQKLQQTELLEEGEK